MIPLKDTVRARELPFVVVLFPTVQERLGHSQVSLTLDVYSHALPTMGREAANRPDALLVV